MINGKYIDLHIHSNNSDGMFSPAELIDMALKNGVGVLSITDHDSISALDEFEKNIPDNFIGVKGIEFSSYIMHDNKKYKIHILGYCYNEENYLFKSLIDEMKEKRICSHLELLQDLKKYYTNIPETEINKLNINRYCWFDREIISCFEKANYPKETIDDLRHYYKKNRFQYKEDYSVDVRRVIDAIHSSGGYVVFAHPMAYSFSKDKDTVYKITKKLIDIGIDGIEIYQSDCLIEDTMWLKQIVDENNLLYSVGSDFHRIINADGRQIGLGIDNNLCIQETSLSNKIIEKKLYMKRG